MVAGQDPDRVYSLLEKHVMDASKHLAEGLHVSLQRKSPGAKAYTAVRDSIPAKLVESVLTKLFGKEPLLMRSGGSVNAFAQFQEAGLECYSFGFGEPDGFTHAPDERFRLSSLHRGQRAYLSIIMEAAQTLGHKYWGKVKQQS